MMLRAAAVVAAVPAPAAEAVPAVVLVPAAPVEAPAVAVRVVLAAVVVDDRAFASNIRIEGETIALK